jgi:formylglycine-generating enzyme required for sulfatase activity
MSDQVWIPGGEFSMGSDRHYPDEGPVRRVTVGEFWIDPTPVTNADFSRFVDETGHVTFAEIAPKAEDYPGAIPEDLVPGSLVFTMTPGPVRLDDYRNWWSWTHGADWRHPTGPGSSIVGMDDHPVVHVAHRDVVAYADWAGRDLPTEAEWEFAARGGLDGAEFTWGEGDAQESPEPKANTWQGRFPYENSEVDGWTRTSPVGSYEPNGYGLYDMAGNVWEWTVDWYQDHVRIEKPCCTIANPRGGTREASIDPRAPQGERIPRKVMKGGSYLCAPNYCQRYRPAARMAQDVDTSTCHLGFRCIVREEQ